MAQTIKTWFSTGNVQFTGTIIAGQYRETMYHLKQWFLSASWTITMSAGRNGLGSFTASVGDNIKHPEDVLIGLDNGTQTSSYFVAVPPSGWLSSGPATQIKVLVMSGENSSSLTPTNLNIYVSKNDFTLHSSPLTNRPRSTSIPVLTQSVSILVSSPVIPEPRVYHAWRTSDGDIWFATSCSGSTQGIRSAIGIVSITGSDNGEGEYRFGLYAASSVSDLSFSLAEMATAANWIGFNASGAVATTTLAFYSIASSMSTWPNGRSVWSNSYVMLPLEGLDNTSAGRYLGRLADIKATTNGMWGQLIDGDTDPVRLVIVNDLWIPTSTSSLPLIG